MTFKIQRVEYFSTMVHGRPADAYELLDTLAGLGINLIAFTSVPMGPSHTHLTIFPEDARQLSNEAQRDQLELDGPHSALIARGDDALGRLAEVHKKVSEANVAVYSTSGITDGEGGFAYVIYVRPEDCDRAVAALQIQPD